MTAYYNEIDPYCCQWLRNLIDAGHIAPGDVDERSIEDVTPDDVRGYTQCHFFAGIGVWSYALRLAGWSDDRPVWTGSCPCQPFSQAGKGAGFADERHLWPAWFHLIRECKPETIFGEQVSSAAALNWIDLVQDDMEAEGYAFAPADICAAGFGAPIRRARVFFVADSDCGRRSARAQHSSTGYGNPVAANDCPSHWACAELVSGSDGKRRLIEPAIQLMAHGYPNRPTVMRAIGNSIIPQVAAAFIGAYLSAPLRRH